MSEADHFQQERRHDARLNGLFPLRVHAKNFEGQSITSYSLADNLCSGGLYFQYPRSLPIGQPLFTLIQLSEGIGIAAQGRIRRIEKKPYGLMGLAICFSRTRIIRLPSSKKKTI